MSPSPAAVAEPAERALARDLAAAVAEVPGLTARVEKAAAHDLDEAFDVALMVTGPAAPTRLLVQCKAASAVYPRDVREWLWRIRGIERPSGPGKSPRVVPVFAATSLSPGVKELLQAEQVGYYDRGGSLFLPLPGAFVLIDRPSPRRQPERSLFSDRRALVLHALLRRVHEPMAVSSLADELGLSAATVSETFSLLDRMDWTRSEGRGPAKRRLLADPGTVLDTWRDHVLEHQPLESRRYFASSRDAAKLAARFSDLCEKAGLRHAITGELAGQAVAPLLSSIQVARCRVAEGADAASILEAVGAKPVSEGASLELLSSTAGELFFTDDSGHGRLADPIQTYLDLVRLPGRAKELGEHLRREKIGF